MKIAVNTVKNSNELYDSASISKLEDSIEDLIQLCNQLREENRALEANQSILLAERSELIGRNETARNQVESIITRLNDMEHETHEN